MSPASMKRLRKIFTRIAWVLGGLMAFALVALLVVAGLLQTDWGRDQVRMQIEEQAGEQLLGDVQIGSIEGNLLSGFSVHDLELRDDSGELVLSAKEVLVDYRLRPALGGEIRISELILIEPRLYLVEGEDGWNVAQLLPEEEEQQPSTLQLSIGSLEIRGGQVMIEGKDRSEQIRDLDLEGDVWISGEDRRGSLRQLSMATSVWPTAIELSARVEDSPILTVVEQARLRSGASSLRLDDLRIIKGDAGRLVHARVSGEVSAEDARRLTSIPTWQAGIRIDATVEQERAEAPLAVRGAARAAGAQLDVVLALALQEESADIELSLDGLDPSALATELPAAQIASEVEASAQRWSEWRSQGQASVSATMTGSIQGRPIETMGLHGQLREGIADAELEVVARGIEARGSAELDVRTEPMEVRRSSLVADIDLQKVRDQLPIDRNATGTVELSAQAQGPLSDLKTRGEARARGLRYEDMRARRVDTKWSLTLGDELPRGSAELQLRSVRVGEQRVGRLDATLESQSADRLQVQLAVRDLYDSAARVRAQVIREQERITVQLPRIWIQARDLVWRGQVGAVHLDDDGAVAVRGVALQSAAGTVQGSARWRTRALGVPDQARVRVSDIDFNVLSRVLDADDRAPLRGTGSVAIDIAPDEAPRLQVELRNLSRRGTPGTIDGTLALRLPQPRRGEYQFDLDAGKDGSLRGQGTLTLRRDWRAPEAWQALGPASVDAMSITASSLRMSTLGRIIDVDMAGTVNGSFAASNGFREAQLDVKAQRLHLRRWLAQPMNADVELRFGDGSLKTDARIATSGAGKMRVLVELGVGAHPLYEIGSHLELKQVKRTELLLDKIDLATFARPFPEWRDLRGQVSARLRIDQQADTARLSFYGEDLEKGRFELGAWRVGVELDSTAKGTELEMSASPDRKPFLKAEAQLPVTLRALLAGDQRWRNQPVRGRLQVPSVSLARIGLQDVAGEPGAPVFAGQLSADFTVAGTVNRPRLNGSALGRDLRYGDVPLPELRMQARAGLEQAHIALELEDKGKGTLRADLTGEPGGDELDLRFSAQKFRLAFLNPLFLQARIPVASLAGELQGKGRLRIAGEERELSGKFTFSDGSISLPQPLQSLHGLQAAVTLHTDKIVARLEGTSSSGSLSANTELLLKDLRPQRITGSVETEDLPLTIQGAGIVASVEAKLAAELDDERWDVQVNLAGGEIHLPSLPSTEKLHPTGELEDVVIVSDAEEEQRVAKRPDATPRGWDLRVVTDKNVRVHGDDLDVELQVTFDIEQRQKLQIEGSLRVPRGEVEILDRKYRVEEARVLLEEGESRPHIYVRVAREFPQASVMVTVSGYPDELELELTAQPSIYTRSEILSLIVKGAPSAASDAPNRDQAILSAIAGLASQQITARLREPLGVDTLTVDTGEGGTVSSVAVGKWITEAIFVAYHRQFAADPNKNQDEVRMEWWLSGDWLFEVRAGDAGAGSGDLLWIYRY